MRSPKQDWPEAGPKPVVEWNPDYREMAQLLQRTLGEHGYAFTGVLMDKDGKQVDVTINWDTRVGDTPWWRKQG